MHISALQFSPVHGDVEKNLKRMRELVDGLAFDLLVVPELASTGYFFTEPETLLPMAEVPEEGMFCSWVRSLASERNGVVVAGFAERDRADRLYNAALVALPDGSYTVYRKTHLFYKEKCVFEPGDRGFSVVQWNGLRIGTMICYDWRFPEAARTLALQGADVIAHPSNLVAAASLWGQVMSTRAIENKVIVATANRCGVERFGDETLAFTGESRIIGMNGRVLAIAGPDEDRVLSAEADHEATRKKSFNAFNDIMADRRPEWYGL